MHRSLSPRDAAEQLGIATETLRRWEREGKISPERTPGGQRRYREEDLRALLVGSQRTSTTNEGRPHVTSNFRPNSSAQAKDAPESEEEAPLITRSVRELPPWEIHIHEERAALEVTKLRGERDAILRTEREAAEERQRKLAKDQRQLAEKRREEEERERVQQREHARLEELRAYGRTRSLSAPPELQAKVIRDLQSFVSSSKFPQELSFATALQCVSARVETILKPWQESIARERAAREREQLRGLKVERAMLQARVRTARWDAEDAEDALEDLRDALEQEITGDSADPDPNRIVDEILEEWEED